MRTISVVPRVIGVLSLAVSVACVAQVTADPTYTAPDAATLTKLQVDAEHGDRNAQRDLALYFDKVKNDWASALPWFRKAADHGDPNHRMPLALPTKTAWA